MLHSGSPISPGLSVGQTRFIPGTIPGTKGGTESLCEKNYVPFSLARHTKFETLIPWHSPRISGVPLNR